MLAYATSVDALRCRVLEPPVDVALVAGVVSMALLVVAVVAAFALVLPLAPGRSFPSTLSLAAVDVPTAP